MLQEVSLDVSLPIKSSNYIELQNVLYPVTKWHIPVAEALLCISDLSSSVPLTVLSEQLPAFPLYECLKIGIHFSFPPYWTRKIFNGRRNQTLSKPD